MTATRNTAGTTLDGVLDTLVTIAAYAGITGNARLLSAAGTSQDSTLVNSTPGWIFHITCRNNRASSVYLKLYNKATAPSVGTDTPIATYEIPASTGQYTLAFADGLYFSTGIGFGLVTALADNSTASVTSADITALNIGYAAA